MIDPDTASSVPATRLMVILFTDLVDSSALKVRLGDHDYVQYIARPHNSIFRELIRKFQGAAERGYTGDGFMATFASVADAVTCALQFQDALRGHQWERAVPQTRVGVHLGDTIEFGETDSHETSLASHAADMTARVMSLGEGGQILMTRAAFDSARQSVRAQPAGGGAPRDLEWLAHGQYRFKGRDEPMEVFEVGVKALAPLRPPADSEKARRVVTDEQALTLGWRPAMDLEIPSRRGWFVVKKLGEGGFGEVWLAQQERTNEVRAFKFCFDPDRLRAFKRELTFFKLIRKGLGNRDDIARLLEVQVDRLPYYLESEYVAGGNLKDWAERHGGIAKVPIELRLQFLATIAHAVASAHSLCIIHKDLKPSNVLIDESIDGHPHPRIADFGIGVLTDPKLLEREGLVGTGFTETILIGNDSSRTGTRLYSPPEALTGGTPTTGWDIYALGVMLYQLVIGDLNRPIGMGWEEHVTDELLRADIRDCVNGDPARRLASADSLQQRLLTIDQRRRELFAEREREAAQARRRRRARAVAFAGGVLAALLVTGAITAALYIRKLKSANLEIERQRNEAEAFAAAARKTVDQFLTEISRDELAIIPGFQETRQKFAEQAVAQYEQFTVRRPDDAAVRFGLAKAKDALGIVVGSIGSLESAVKDLQEAVSLQEKNVAQFPTKHEYQLALATARVDLSHLYWEVSQDQDAQPLLASAIKELEALLTGGSDDPDVKYQLAKACNLRANIARETATTNDNKADLDRSADLFNQSLKAGFRKMDSLGGLSAAKHNLSLIAKDDKNYDLSLKLIDESDDDQKQALALAPASPSLLSNLAISLWNRSVLLAQMKRTDEALGTCSNAVHLLRDVVQANPKVTLFRGLLAQTLQKYGRLLSSTGSLGLSRASYEESCKILEELGHQADDRPDYAVGLVNGQLQLATFLQGRAGGVKRDDTAYGQALVLALTTARTMAAKYPKATKVWFQLCRSLSECADFEAELGKDALAMDALREFEKVFELHVWLQGANRDPYQLSQFLQAMSNVQDIGMRLKQTNEVCRAADAAWGVARDCTVRQGISDLARLLNYKATILTDAGQYQEAIQAREQAVQISREALGKAPWHWWLRQDVGGSYMHLAELYQKVADMPKEVRARQQYLRTIGRPFFGIDVTGYLDPDAAPSEAEVSRLRDLMGKKHDILRFNIPAKFDGLTYPFTIYVTDVPSGKDPLEDQARWLEEERGGIVGDDVRAAFRNLHDRAHNNNLSFMTLCEEPEFLKLCQSFFDAETNGLKQAGAAAPK